MRLAGNIHERIGDLRSERNLSQKQLSKLIGVAPSQLSRIESGETKTISSDILIKLTKAMHVSADYILCLTNIPSPKNYDISELGLSEGTVKTLVSDATDVQIVNRIMEHKRFPYLMLLLKRYMNDETAAGIMERNDVIDFATSTLSDFIKDNPEHRTEAREDIRYFRSEKLGEHEADLEKIKSTFMAIIRDVKSGIGGKNEAAPTATGEFMRGIWAQLGDKPRSEVTAEDVSDAVMKVVGQTTKLDGKSADLFKRIVTKILKTSKK